MYTVKVLSPSIATVQRINSGSRHANLFWYGLAQFPSLVAPQAATRDMGEGGSPEQQGQPPPPRWGLGLPGPEGLGRLQRGLRAGGRPQTVQVKLLKENTDEGVPLKTDT